MSNKYFVSIKQNELDSKYQKEFHTFYNLNDAIRYVERFFTNLGDPKWHMETLDGETWFTFTREYAAVDQLAFIEVQS